MENFQFIRPCLKQRKLQEGREVFSLDFSNCSNEDKNDFILNVITEHHNKEITINTDIKSGTDIDVSVIWTNGCDKEAMKVIKRIESLISK